MCITSATITLKLLLWWIDRLLLNCYFKRQYDCKDRFRLLCSVFIRFAILFAASVAYTHEYLWYCNIFSVDWQQCLVAELKSLLQKNCLIKSFTVAFSLTSLSVLRFSSQRIFLVWTRLLPPKKYLALPVFQDHVNVFASGLGVQISSLSCLQNVAPLWITLQFYFGWFRNGKVSHLWNADLAVAPLFSRVLLPIVLQGIPVAVASSLSRWWWHAHD